MKDDKVGLMSMCLDRQRISVQCNDETTPTVIVFDRASVCVDRWLLMRNIRGALADF